LNSLSKDIRHKTKDKFIVQSIKYAYIGNLFYSRAWKQTMTTRSTEKVYAESTHTHVHSFKQSSLPVTNWKVLKDGMEIEDNNGSKTDAQQQSLWIISALGLWGLSIKKRGWLGCHHGCVPVGPTPCRSQSLWVRLPICPNPCGSDSL
jgi:hypothetical protein